MQSKHQGILNAINGGENRPLNILSFPVHESYQSNWASMPHTFYLWQGQGIKSWNFKYRTLPKNHVLLNGSPNQLPLDVKLDLCLSQNVSGNFPVAQKIAEERNIPLVCLTHTLPPPEWNQKILDHTKQYRGQINVFISQYSMKKWGWTLEDPTVRVVHHGIDTDKFKPNPSIERKAHALAIVNDFRNRQWCCGFNEWTKLVKDIPNILRGDNPGLSKPTESIDELVGEYCSASCFVNSSLISPIPSVVLESLSCGLPVCTLNNCMLPEIIKDGYNGFISNDLDVLKLHITELLENNRLRKELGENARQTILDHFSLKKHLENWESVFQSVVGQGYGY